ncbi:MAG: DUF120 domain-containing protein [Candidatus Micrarchaeota archaeon]
MSTIEINGIIVSGMGEGKRFLPIPSYAKGIEALLGFLPFPGTLNIKHGEGRSILEGGRQLRLEGFLEKGKAFGSLKLFPCKISGVDCAIVVPERTRHDGSILEIVAPVELRAVLKVRDGDCVRIEIRQEKGGNRDGKRD